MPNLDINADGQTLIIPGAYYYDNVSAAFITSAALVPPLVWVCFSYGGVKNVPASFTTAQDTLTFLRGAPCSDMVPFIFTPSSELNGASIVTIIPVGTNTASSYTYSNASAVPVLTVTSANQGLASNLLQTSVVSGSIGGREITLFDGYSGASIYSDNLGVPFQFAYAGAATGVTYTVTTVANQATTLTTSGAPTGQNFVAQIGLGGYTTVTELVEYINGTGFYNAQVITGGPTYSHGNLPTQMLDAIGPVALQPMASGNLVYHTVGAALNDIAYWMQTSASNFVNPATLLVSSAFANLPAVLPLTHFAGGTNVPPILTDYAAGLNVALGVQAWVVIADQNITGLPALLAQHALTASSITQRRWRRAVSGSNIGDALVTVQNMAIGLNTLQMTYCYPGIYRNNQTTGVNTLYGGYYVAAAVAGIMAGNPVMTSLTNKTLTGNGVEVQSLVSAVDTLQQSGVMPIWVDPNSGVPTVISDFTTWQNDANPENVFNQQVAGRQYLSYVMVQANAPYTGAIESSVSIGIQRAANVAALNGQIVSPNASFGVLNSWNASTLQLNYSGSQQLTTITFQCTFVGQNRFTVIEAFVQPLNLSA